MSSKVTIIGCDPHPSGGHFVLTEWSLSANGHPELLLATIDFPWFCDFAHYVVEDPRGVLYQGTNSVLWSRTCVEAGRIAGACNAEFVKPAIARESLAKAARSDQAPRKDREVRELLEVVYGANAFDFGKLCPKRKNKSHGPNCPTCGGSGMERALGVLSELKGTHYKDAFVVAQHVAMRMAGVATK